MTRTFASVSEAVGYADALLIHRGQIRKPKRFHGGPPPDEAAAIMVLQAMRTAGCPWDSDAGRSVIEWARAPDDVGLQADPVARRMLTLVLEQAGLVPPPPTPVRIGYRVHVHPNGRRQTMVVPDPDPGEVRSGRVVVAASKSAALASKYLDIELLSSGSPAAPAKPSRDEVRAEATAMIIEQRPMMDVYAHIAARLGVSLMTARRLRSRWVAEAAESGGPWAMVETP
jgi:hypothetical protein